MTSYTPINATEVQANKPITEALMTRLAFNLVAVTEGDPTAPKISNLAFDEGELIFTFSASSNDSISANFDHLQNFPVRCIIIASATLEDSRPASSPDISIQVNGSTVMSRNDIGTSAATLHWFGTIGAGSNSLGLTVTGGSQTRITVLGLIR